MQTVIEAVHFGDSAVMMPAAAAIAAWFFIREKWRLALLWCLLFGLSLTTVAMSKMAFLGWGLEIKSINLKGLSGHAMRVAAVMPVISYLLAQHKNALMRVVAYLVGIAFGIAMVTLLTAFDFHSMSESMGGFLVGAVVSFNFVYRVERFPIQRHPLWGIPAIWLVFIGVWTLVPLPLDQWLANASLFLSGKEILYQGR